MKRAALLVTLAAVCGAASSSAAAASRYEQFTIPANRGEVANEWLPYPGPPRAFALLPSGYDPERAYPVLFLLNGLSSDYASWSDQGPYAISNNTPAGLPSDLAGLGAIVIMPEGASGWYTDWWDDGKRDGPNWESYFLDEVIPQVEARYRILAGRRYHAIAGNSMGGLGAVYLGGRLPGYFGTVISLSGLDDLQQYPWTNGAQSVISQAEASQLPDPNGVTGPYEQFYATGHNPPDLAANLRESRVWMAAGDGNPAPGDNIASTEFATDSTLERLIIRPASDAYAAALKRAGVDVTYRPRAGAHNWLNFNQQLRDARAWGLFNPVVEQPTNWVNDTVATHGNLWGDSYDFAARPNAIVRFTRRGSRLAVSAAGTPVTITTPGGCALHLATPGSVTVPTRACERLAVAIHPHRLTVGRCTATRVIVSPAVAPVVVRIGVHHPSADVTGLTILRLCPRSRQPLVFSVTAPGFERARDVVRVNGP